MSFVVIADHNSGGRNIQPLDVVARNTHYIGTEFLEVSNMPSNNDFCRPFC